MARELIDEKLARQEVLARDALGNPKAGQTIASARTALPSASTFENIRYVEAQGGHAYWSAWRSVPVTFPRTDLPRIPDHWRVFGSRMSPLTKSPRLAANPSNAILNYLYAILEAEARSAVAALGLDPGLGFLHMDTRTRDSLACDVMEPVRPQVDGYVLNWIKQESLRREWFFEERDGNCRLMASFAARRAATMPMNSSATRSLPAFAKIQNSLPRSTRLNIQKRRSRATEERPNERIRYLPVYVVLRMYFVFSRIDRDRSEAAVFARTPAITGKQILNPTVSDIALFMIRLLPKALP